MMIQFKTDLKGLTVVFLVLLLFSCSRQKWSETEKGDLRYVSNKGGHGFVYSAQSGVKLLIQNGFAFKDLNRNGELDFYEDWRLPVDIRARDLASKLSIEQIAGLMLYSGHQSIPASGRGMFGGTYNGKSFAESGADSWALTDQQIKFLKDDNLRHVLITKVENPEVAARWNNAMQSLIEGIGLGIPANNSSDPRHGIEAATEYNYGAGGLISMWPGSLGMAATFDPDLVKQFGIIASEEYRALGITTALSPQIDLATEPRWNRANGTFGEDPQLSADMASSYVDGFQSSYDSAEISGGWGFRSVNTMVKHWPGGGPEEGGRDGHFGYGAYAVYPGNNLQDHLKPFVDGAFKLDGKTRVAAAVMPYYTISFGQDTVNNDTVANGFNKYLITGLLRGKYNYDGVVCTDWLITGDVQNVEVFQGKPWGVEKLTVAERHYKVIMAGVDQFGGNNLAGPVIEAFKMGVAEHGENIMRHRFEASAVRLLRNIFRVGLFENPYLDVDKTIKTVGNPEFMKAGFDAQLKSVVLLKNMSNTLPLKKGAKIYIPKRFIAPGRDWFGNISPEKWEMPVNADLAKKYFELSENPSEADYGLVFIDSPKGMTGYDRADVEKGGNGYVPISLQYGTYTAIDAREISIAGGSVFEPFTNRSYKGKSVTASNYSDLLMVNQTIKAMKGKPVIIVVNVSNPMVFSEIEPVANAILAHFTVQDQAIFEILTGTSQPSGLLPMQMPANMRTVELQSEDCPHDMECHVDSEGNRYDFGFGLNWSGKIQDSRTARYCKLR